MTWWWGLRALRILQGEGEKSTKSSGPQNPVMGVLNIQGPRSVHVFAGSSGGSTTCEHSQELIPGLLQL